MFYEVVGMRLVKQIFCSCPEHTVLYCPRKSHFQKLILLTQTKIRCSLRHCILVLEASLQTLVQFQAVSQLAVIESPNWPSVVRV